MKYKISTTVALKENILKIKMGGGIPLYFLLPTLRLRSVTLAQAEGESEVEETQQMALSTCRSHMKKGAGLPKMENKKT